MRQKNRLLIIGCGDTGQEILKQKALRYHRTRIFITNTEPKTLHSPILNTTLTPLVVNLDNRHSLKRLRALGQKIIMLCPPAQEGFEDRRSKNLSLTLRRPHARRLSCLASSIHHHSRHLKPNYQAKHTLIYISTTGVYGNANGQLLKEHNRPMAQTPRAKRRLSAEKIWRNLGKAKQGTIKWRVHILRVPGIYGKDRLPLARLQQQLPTLLPQYDVYTNHIAIEDLAQSCWIALQRGRPQRITQVTDGQTLLMGDYLRQVAQFLGLPSPPALPPDQVKAAVTPMMWSFMQESRQLSNQRLLSELKVTLKIPNLATALNTWFPVK